MASWRGTGVGVGVGVGVGGVGGSGSDGVGPKIAGGCDDVGTSSNNHHHRRTMSGEESGWSPSSDDPLRSVVVVERCKCPVTYGDLSCIGGRRWFNDVIVNVYGMLLQVRGARAWPDRPELMPVGGAVVLPWDSEAFPPPQEVAKDPMRRRALLASLQRVMTGVKGPPPCRSGNTGTRTSGGDDDDDDDDDDGEEEIAEEDEEEDEEERKGEVEEEDEEDDAEVVVHVEQRDETRLQKRVRQDRTGDITTTKKRKVTRHQETYPRPGGSQWGGGLKRSDPHNPPRGKQGPTRTTSTTMHTRTKERNDVERKNQNTMRDKKNNNKEEKEKEKEKKKKKKKKKKAARTGILVTRERISTARRHALMQYFLDTGRGPPLLTDHQHQYRHHHQQQQHQQQQQQQQQQQPQPQPWGPWGRPPSLLVLSSFFYTLLAGSAGGRKVGTSTSGWGMGKKGGRNALPLPAEYTEGGFAWPSVGYDYARVSRWTNKKGLEKPTLSVDMVLIPIHVREEHWALASVHPSERRILYYDSLGNGNHVDDVQSEVRSNLLQWVFDESETKGVDVGKRRDWRSKAMVVPRQVQYIYIYIYTTDDSHICTYSMYHFNDDETKRWRITDHESRSTSYRVPLSLSLSLYTHTHTHIYMYKTYVTFSTNTHIIHDMVWYGMIYIFFLSLFIFLLPFVNV